MNEPRGNFLDKKTLIAIALTMVVWIGWQSYMQKKYPPAKKTAEVAETAKAARTEETKKTDFSQAPAPAEEKPAEAETLVEVDSVAWSFKISSHGMGLRDIRLKRYMDAEDQPIRIGAELDGRLPLETNLIGRTQALNFDIEKVSDTHFVGRARLGELEITKTLTLEPGRFLIDSEVAVEGQSDQFMGLATYLVSPLIESKGGSFLSPQVETQDVYLYSSETSERLHLKHDEAQTLDLKNATVAAIGTHYFTQALVDRSDVLPEVKARTNPATRTVLASVNHQVLNRSAEMKISYSAFLGPKNLTILKSVDENLAGIVNFGFFSALGRPILKTLKWFHSLTGNWGVAIILLTLLVRFLVLPFNVMSFRSMKAMQMIQPQIQALKERHKKDPNRLNQEMLALFKTHRVNPVGGCLPVLLQIPIFFALYQVLGQSVELYQAPFMLWIHDLSQKDPYFVLPVLMGITMFVQQKVTPTTMDPAQAKIMMFMPLIFSVFMLALPSGLTLYIFVSALFGILQQLYLLKSQKNLKPVTAN
jgi:YidC/Oxa1 family membrane protein insertase